MVREAPTDEDAPAVAAVPDATRESSESGEKGRAGRPGTAAAAAAAELVMAGAGVVVVAALPARALPKREKVRPKAAPTRLRLAAGWSRSAGASSSSSSPLLGCEWAG